MTGHTNNLTLRDEIEIRIARGWEFQRIALDLGITVAKVQACYDAMLAPEKPWTPR